MPPTALSIEIFISGNFSISYSTLFEVFRNKSSRKHSAVTEYILNRFSNSNQSESEIKTLTERAKRLCRQFKNKWQSCNRTLNRFLIQNKEWLQNDFKICLTGDKNNSLNSSASCSSLGRPRLSYNRKSERSRRREASTIINECNHHPSPEALIHAASSAARAAGNLDLAVVLNQILQRPSFPSQIREFLSNTKTMPKSYTPEEALSFLLDNNLSKSQYMNIRLGSKQRNADIYPPYAAILKTKLECRVMDLTVTETSVKVSLNSLLDHTAQRIVQLQKEVVTHHMNVKSLTFCEAVLIVSYGCDGSSGHSNYKQKFTCNKDDPDDSNLFATTIVPLRLVTSDTNTILWNNVTPQSIRFCRPLKLQYIKESKALILEEKSNLDEEIRNLQHLNLHVTDDKILRVKFNLHMTLIDGKVLNVLTDTKSSQSCPICGATPKVFQRTFNFDSSIFDPKPNTLQYGISPLHAWIRFFECILHISYRIDIKTWQVRGTTEKELFKKRKLQIQNRFWKEMGLHVDKPKCNGPGTTNDGNTSRRAFGNPKIFAQITNVDEELINRFGNILIALSCHYPLNADLFGTYCIDTAKRYVEHYKWYPMPASVHKILVHGKQILLNSVLPVGVFGEDAAESRNKFYKRDRETHARKDSRRHNLEDVFNRALDTSDPVISSITLSSRLNKKDHLHCLPSDVIAFLSNSE